MKTRFYSRRGKARFILIAIVMVALVALLVMLLWNWLMPAMFSLSPITYLQALGLLVLSKILFSGFGRGRGHRYSHGPWKKRFMEKWHHCKEEDQRNTETSHDPES